MVLLPHRKVERFSRLACTTLHVHINCTPDADTFLLHIWEGLILHGPAQLPCFLNMYCSYLPGLDDNFTTAQTTVYQPLLADVSLLTQIPRCYSNVQSPSYLAICNVNTSYCHSSLSSLDRVDINAHTLHLSDSGIYVCIGVGANTSYSFELNVVGKRLPFYLFFFRSFFCIRVRWYCWQTGDSQLFVCVEYLKEHGMKYERHKKGAYLPTLPVTQ